MNVIIVENEAQLQDAFYVRTKVFIEEQEVPKEEEIDQFDTLDKATHFVMYNNEDQPIGAGRFRQIDGYGKIERICILSQYRKTGAGKILMNQIINFAKEQGLTRAKLHAQTHAIPFYEKLGFNITSDEFMDAGIPHKEMKCSL